VRTAPHESDRVSSSGASFQIFVVLKIALR